MAIPDAGPTGRLDPEGGLRMRRALARLTGFEVSGRPGFIPPEAELASAYLLTAGTGIALVLAIALGLGAGDRGVLGVLLGLLLVGASISILAGRRRSPEWAAGAALSALLGWPLLVPAMALASATTGTYEHAPVAVVAILTASSLSVVLQTRVAVFWLAGQISFLGAAFWVVGDLGGAAWIGLVGAAVAGILGLVGRIMLDRLGRAHNRLAELMHCLAPGESLSDTAESIVAEVAEAAGFALVLLGAFLPDGTVRHLAHSSRLPGELPVVAGLQVDEERAGYLRSRVHDGPWVADWEATEESSNYDRRMYEAGLRITLHAPIVHAGAVVGVLGVGYGAGTGAGGLHRRALLYGSLPSVVEAASLIGSILAPQLAALDDQSIEIGILRSMIDERSFAPVFQPIVELASGTIVGYEALTRFSYGERPDRVFAAANRVGLGQDFELATMAAAVAASDGLEPVSAYLSVNLSPEFVLSGLASPLLGLVRRPVTVEVTEHVPIDDYAALRTAVRAFGPGVRLAVDDAGAGFASLRHVLELRPDVVKLDIGLVRGIDSDPARQALVAGMVHFSDRGAFRLVAEGIETEAERAALLALRVDYGQGYLFGRAESAPVSTRRQRDVA